MSNRFRASAFALLALAVGCREPPQLRVVRRLLDERSPNPSRQATAQPGIVGIRNVRRPVLAASQGIPPEIHCPQPSAVPTRHRRCRVSIPRDAPRAPGWILETAPIAVLRVNVKRAAGRELGRRGDLERRMRVPFPARRRAGQTPSLQLPEWLALFSKAWPTPSLPEHDFLSQPLLVPPGAVLTFAIGTEEPAWHVDTPAAQFTVEARRERGSVELYRRVLDPRRRPADRGWHEETVALAPVAGETVRLRLKVRPATPGPLAPQLPLWADPTVLAPAAPRATRLPSVVLVSLDTLRAKSVSAYGRTRLTTPFLNRFSSRATRFANVFTTYSNTFGAHISMLTGAHPSAHVPGGGLHSLSPDVETLAERLRTAGYTTAAFTEDALLDATAGFERGFSRYWENTTVDTGSGDAPGTFARALAWLADHRDRPVFVFAHTYAVHAPYKPAPAYRDFFRNDAEQATRGDALARKMESRGFDAETASLAVQLDGLLAYEQEIRQLDDDVASMVARLDDLLDPRETLLVVTADHGEEFSEHGAISHVQLYDEVLHVPLWMRWPGQVPAGRRIDALASLLDVTPTILDLVGLDHKVASGLSLGPLLRGEAEHLDRPMVLAESPPSVWSDRQWGYVARTVSAKCFAFGDPALDRCFDLEGDPGETRPLPANEALAGLHEVARVFANVALKTRGRRKPGPGGDDAEPHPDPTRVEKLRALGYVD